ncbi:MAG: ABC transporter ATP-binding protein [Syntrophales bacterium]|nr:ABC transporter ATP-binding protein [Syntrophales bacterium]
MTELLRIEDLATHFFTNRGIVRAVEGVDLSMAKGEVLGVVGESGCGKTVLALSVMRLLPASTARIVRGTITFDGLSLLELPDEEMRKIRGSRISMIFQEPMTALNPVFRIGDQIMEAVHAHRKVSKKEARDMAVEMLTRVGFPAAEKRINDYPHQLSGGMRQRVMIAMALILEPELMIADEPTTALDVTIQAQIVSLLKDLQSSLGTSILFITHDLGVVCEIAERIAVMYAGEIVEMASTEELFSSPLHPYTLGLMESIPPDDLPSMRDARLRSIPGSVLLLSQEVKGCRFQERCSDKMSKCSHGRPLLCEKKPGHFVRCWKYE